MKCPRCGSAMTGKSKCEKCSFDIAGPQGKIEVEYKDFKTSELLEIRHKKQAAHEAEEIKPITEKALKRELAEDEKKPFPFLVALTLALILIAAAFLIFRYFLMR